MNGSIMKWFAIMVVVVVAEVLVFAAVMVAVTGSVDAMAAVGDMVLKVLIGLHPQ